MRPPPQRRPQRPAALCAAHSGSLRCLPAATVYAGDAPWRADARLAKRRMRGSVLPRPARCRASAGPPVAFSSADVSPCARSRTLTSRRTTIWSPLGCIPCQARHE